MPMFGWKPEFQLQKKQWGPPPDIGPHKVVKKAQLVKTKPPPQQRAPTEDELRILYERDIYRMCSMHASLEELQKQYEQVKDEKVYPGMIKAWLMNSYEGETDGMGMPEGQGSADLAGLHYRGTFRQGLLHGSGLLQWGKDSSYEGDFYCNRLLGYGTYSWAGGAKYIGEIFDGEPHGRGVMEGEEGLRYEGSWEYGNRHGQGKMTFGETAVYDGNWKNDQKHGQGHLVFKSGSFYLGNWLEGKKHGEGNTQVQRIIPSKEKACRAALYSHGLALDGSPDCIYAHRYKGDWMGGLPHGSGRSEWPWDSKEEDKSVLMNSYVGSYENGMRHGEGSFFYASGAVFKGHWRENMKVGLGVLVYETGKLHFGLFSHDRYDPISNPGLNIAEPLESALCFAADDLETARYGVWRAIMRHKNTIQQAFLLYCSIRKQPVPPKPMVPPAPLVVDDKKLNKGKGDDPKKSPKEEKEGNPTKELPKVKSVKGQPSKEDKKEKQEKEAKERTAKLNFKEDLKEEIVIDIPEEPVLYLEEDRPRSPRPIAGRVRGMSNEQLWRFLHDGHMLDLGIGYAEVDRMLPSNDLSWDPVSDVHSYTRQLILREVVSVLIQISLLRFQDHQISSEDKIEKLLASHLPLLEFIDDDSLFAKVELSLVKGVLSDNRQTLDKLFCGLLLESETPDYSIKLQALVQFGQSSRPEIDVPAGALLAKVALEVYHRDIASGDESKLLDQDVNYKEYEVILMLFAIMLKVPLHIGLILEGHEDDLKKLRNSPDEDTNIKDVVGKTKALEKDEKNVAGAPQENISFEISTNSDPKAKDNRKNEPVAVVDSIAQKVNKKIIIAEVEGLVDAPNANNKVKGKNDREPNSSKDDERQLAIKDMNDYEKALADLLKNFILEVVAVSTVPIGARGDTSKSLRAKVQKVPKKK